MSNGTVKAAERVALAALRNPNLATALATAVRKMHETCGNVAEGADCPDCDALDELVSAVEDLTIFDRNAARQASAVARVRAGAR